MRFKWAYLWLLFPAVLGLAITRQSLWIDEGFTVWFASHRNVASFFSSVIASDADSQMFLYLLYMWGWVRVFGTSELALRAANIPFAILLAGAMIWVSWNLLQRSKVWVIVCLSPFIWFYMNEARPYIALMALSAVSLVAMLAYLTDSRRYKVCAPWCCLTALLLAWGIHILAAFIVPSFLFMLAATARNNVSLRENVIRDWSPSFVVHLPLFGALGAFYAWTVVHGDNIRKGEPGLANVGFSFYEFMGFAGLGPPRQELRGNLRLEAITAYWPWLLVGASAVVMLVCFLLLVRPTEVARNLATSVVFGVAIAFVFSKAVHFGFWGRHMAVFCPMLLIVLMLWTKPTTLPRGRQLTAATLSVLGLAWVISDARLSVLHKYEKDSYRAASSIALERAHLLGSEILWAADPRVAYYYGLQMNSLPGADIDRRDIAKDVTWPVQEQALDAENWSVEEATTYLGARNTPLVLVLGKADLFDAKRAWRTLIKQQCPTLLADLNAFQVYEWGPVVTSAGVPR